MTIVKIIIIVVIIIIAHGMGSGSKSAKEFGEQEGWSEEEWSLYKSKNKQGKMIEYGLYALAGVLGIFFWS